VLSANLELVDLDVRHVEAWWRLLLPPDFSWAIAFVEGPAVVQVVTSAAGEIEPTEIAWSGRATPALAALRKSLDVGALAVVETAALRQIFAATAQENAAEADPVAEWLRLWRAIKRAAGQGHVQLDPPIFDLLPAPSYKALQAPFDLLVPDLSAVVAYVFDDAAGEIDASLIASKEDGDIVLATTHMALADAVAEAELVRAWRKHRRRVVDIVGDRFDPVSLGIFASRDAVQRILGGPRDQLARELDDGHLILDPAPAWLRALLGGAKMASKATRGAATLSRLMTAPARQSVRRVAAELASSTQDRLRGSALNPFTHLGFDPIALWLEVRRAFWPAPPRRRARSRRP
jgi:hypothetical protein